MEIAKLAAEIEEMEEARTNATKIREAEHAVYMKSKTELDETITSMKECMEGGFLQAKTLIEAWGGKQEQHSRVMHQFMQKKQKSEPTDYAAKFEDRGGGDATYVAKGGDVTEILKKMLMEYEDDLVALDKSEAETKAAYDLADDAKKLAIAASTKPKETKEEVLGEKGQELSNTQSDLKEAQDALLADTTVLDETTTTCKTRGDEYEQHMKTRDGELQAMQQAIEILTKVTGVRTPESKGISTTLVVPEFAQLMQVRKHAHSPAKEVVAVLRKVQHAVALSKLADKIEKLGADQMPGSGVFDQIKNMIQKMIFHLMDEQKNEDEHKKWCDKEITNTELMLTEKTAKSQDATSTITQLAEKIQNLKNGIKENQDFIAETTEEIAQRTEDRAEDKKENEATIKDAEDAQNAIANAIAVLETFYKESGEVAKEAWEAFAQTKAVAHRQHAEPEPELWEEEKYTGTEGGAAVIGMLENCATDFAKMESQARADETAHQDAFDTFLTQAKMDKAARTKDTEMKQSRKGRFEEKMDKAARTKDT